MHIVALRLRAVERAVTFENWSMTSGMTLLFPGDMEDELLKQWHRPQRGRN